MSVFADVRDAATADEVASDVADCSVVIELEDVAVQHNFIVIVIENM